VPAGAETVINDPGDLGCQRSLERLVTPQQG